jgi:hypothetical protein
MSPDMEYINTGIFTRFVPNTKAGEEAWKVMHADNGNDVVLAIHAKSVIGQLRKAGYTVEKAKKPTQTIDDILKELEA